MSLQDDIARYANETAPMISGERTGKRIAAGLERDYYLVKLADLPKVERLDTTAGIARFSDGPRWHFDALELEEIQEEVHRWIAIHSHAESRESEDAARQARRDELVRECAPDVIDYDEAHGWLKAAVDRIIAAEAEVARLKEGRA